MVGTVALVPPTLSFTIILVVVPYSVASLQTISSCSNFAYLLLSVNQDKELQKIQSETIPQVWAVLTQSQQAQLDTKLVQGQNLWQGLAILDLSETQQSLVKSIMKSQRLKMFKLLTPEQRRQLGRSLPVELFQ
jgi:Spy/CpxP family protein refolding chaperone